MFSSAPFSQITSTYVLPVVWKISFPYETRKEMLLILSSLLLFILFIIAICNAIQLIFIYVQT
jgi:hypothetical protein